MLWCDNGAHFDSTLFRLYLAKYQENRKKTFSLNYHVAGEGKCDLDRYFGLMNARETRYVLSGKDIIGDFLHSSYTNFLQEYKYI